MMAKCDRGSRWDLFRLKPSLAFTNDGEHRAEVGAMLIKDADVIFNDEYGLWQGVMSLWGFWCLTST
jgi:hypothetical protein